MRKLDHDKIIRYYASFVVEKDLYIVLELADAGDLNRLIKVDLCDNVLYERTSNSGRTNAVWV